MCNSRDFIVSISDLIKSLNLKHRQRKCLSIFVKNYINWQQYYKKRDIKFEKMVYNIIYRFVNINNNVYDPNSFQLFSSLRSRSCRMYQEISTINTLICIKRQKVTMMF